MKVDLKDFTEQKAERHKQIVSDASGKPLTDKDIDGFARSSEWDIGPDNTFYSSASMPNLMHDYTFRGADSVPIDIAQKRIEKFRKKYPESEGCLDELKKKAYPDGFSGLKHRFLQSIGRNSASIMSSSSNSSSASSVSSSNSSIMSFIKKKLTK